MGFPREKRGLPLAQLATLSGQCGLGQESLAEERNSGCALVADIKKDQGSSLQSTQ